MRFLPLALISVSLSAAFAPRSSLVFLAAVIVAIATLVRFSFEDGIIASTLVLGGPLLVRTFPFPLLLRVGFLAFFVALFLLFRSDFLKRRRGAPIVPSRFEFFVSAGIVAVSATLFAFASASSVLAALILFAVAMVTGGAIVVIRSANIRSRGVVEAATPLFVDAIVVAFLAVEYFLALAFLPLSPLTLAAIFTVCFWATMTILARSRAGTLTPGKAFRIGVSLIVLLMTLLVSVPWVSVSL